MSDTAVNRATELRDVGDDASMVSRRGFLIAAAAMAPALAAGRLVAQAVVPGANMEGDGYVPVGLPPKPNATTSLTSAERDALEQRIACPCPCTLDVFTCRTSMPTCGFSPRIHRDVMGLVQGGYTADEILATFQGAYGEQILMAPTKEGFNLVGWFAPFVAIGAGAIAVFGLLHRWRRPEGETAARVATPIGVTATDDEMARLQAAIRNEES